jgi:hypothetical protein
MHHARQMARQQPRREPRDPLPAALVIASCAMLGLSVYVVHMSKATLASCGL